MLTDDVGPSGFRDCGKRTELAELPHENGILSNQMEFAESAIFWVSFNSLHTSAAYRRRNLSLLISPVPPQVGMSPLCLFTQSRLHY